MADDQGGYDFDLELYCIVCDRQIDPTSPPADFTRQSSAPSPPPNRLATSVNHVPTAPNPTPSSSKSNHHPPPSNTAPKLKRTGSGHSSTSNGGTKSNASSSGGLKRNRSVGKGHHAAGGGGVHRRNSSHANLHALAPMKTTTTTTTANGGKKAPVAGAGSAAEREKGKTKDTAAKQEATSQVRPAEIASTLYCSEECKQIDEARNQLAVAHLGGGSDSPVPASFPLPSPNSGDFESESPYAQMIRRRSSGVSSTGSTSYAFSSVGERGLSPILSAAPSSNPAPYLDSSGFPFPSVSSGSSTLARTSPSNAMTSHPSNSSLNSLPSQQSYQGPPPLLNFSSRRQSRGAHSSGAYSYRPSLMERVHSTDSADSGVSETRNARSLSIGNGGFSAGLFNRVRSVDGIAMMGRSDSEASDREGRSAQAHRPPSALSSLRSMTPILNGPPPASSSRSRPPLPTHGRYSEPGSFSSSPAGDRPQTARIASDSVASSESRSRSRSRKSHHPSLPPSRARSRPPPTTSPLIAGSDPPQPFVGSLPAPRSKGLSFGSPTTTTSLLRPVPLALESSLAPRRTSSSASLALLGSSLSKSYDNRAGPLAGWSGLKRTDSTAGLSGLNAVGEISLPSGSSLPPSSSSTASTFIPAPSTYQQRHQFSSSSRQHDQRPRRPSSSHSHPHSSPSSATSSFGPSHSSVRTSSSSRRSTAASSDHWQGIVSSSIGSSAGGGKGTSSAMMHRARSGSSSRPDRPSTSNSSGGGGGGTSNRIKQGGLTMTPSTTNLTSIAGPHHSSSSLAPAVPSTTTGSTNAGLGAVASRTWSWTNLHVPTYQALDVSDFRARKERTEKGLGDGDLGNGEANGERVGSSQGEGSQVLPKKERKRLFYFSDNGE
ncbi:uncharacterized protein JCM6883_002537 [Sporobolomyces salmoneus]|uniref:uncharacterized protein n=1 Tax=Sporobolomyces salmoneus TaxID=183962 RepID=UPI003181E8F3